jgi:hypothetical protein
LKKNGYERKKSLSLHISVDAKSKKLVSFRITKGNVHESRKLGPFVRKAAEKCDIDKVHADKAHGNRRENFNILDDLNVEPAIGIRKNATSIRARGCQLRKDEVILIRDLVSRMETAQRCRKKMDCWNNNIFFNQTCFGRTLVIREI